MLSKKSSRACREAGTWWLCPRRIGHEPPSGLFTIFFKYIRCEDKVIEWEFIQPGKPTQNSLIERFNRTFRQDVLDSYMFESLKEIRKYANAWVWMYNNERPHSSLGQLTPTEFLLKYGKLSEFPTFQQDNNSNSDWNFLV